MTVFMLILIFGLLMSVFYPVASAFIASVVLRSIAYVFICAVAFIGFYLYWVNYICTICG